jgi:hypothetical protein
MKAYVPRHSTILSLGGWQTSMGSLMSGFQFLSKQSKPYFLEIGLLAKNGAVPTMLRILADMKRARPSSLDYWTKYSDVIIIRSCDTQSLSLTRSALDVSMRVQFLLVLTEEGCNSAPSSVEMLSETFASVESVCRMGPGRDSGAVLYRLISPIPAEKSVHLSSAIRRLSGDILLREFRLFAENGNRV